MYCMSAHFTIPSLTENQMYITLSTYKYWCYWYWLISLGYRILMIYLWTNKGRRISKGDAIEWRARSDTVTMFLCIKSCFSNSCFNTFSFNDILSFSFIRCSWDILCNFFFSVYNLFLHHPLKVRGISWSQNKNTKSGVWRLGQALPLTSHGTMSLNLDEPDSLPVNHKGNNMYQNYPLGFMSDMR